METITVTELSRFAYPRENPALLTKKFGFQKETSSPSALGEEPSVSPREGGILAHSAYETDAGLSRASTDGALFDNLAPIPGIAREVPLEMTVPCGSLTVSVRGTADIVSFDGVRHTVEEVKTKSRLSPGLTPFDDPSAFAQAVCYAYLLLQLEGGEEAVVRLTFLHRATGERLSFSAVFSVSTLRSLFEALLLRAAPFLQYRADQRLFFPGEAASSPFPFPNLREGQRAFIYRTFRTVKNGGSLFVSAPTGIGKTMAALYPSVKALSVGKIQKIFYLTSKTVTGYAALDGARTLRLHIPHLSALLITAKETNCPFRRAPLPPDCSFCSRLREQYAPDGTFVSYRERQHTALLSLLYADDRVYTTERIQSAAEESSVCPYELSLDLSRFCHVVVCDYNYAYDDGIRFQRYFKAPPEENEKRDYAFLIDEAHNLPDRVRDMYSAELSTELLEGLFHVCRGGETEVPTLYSAVEEAKRLMETVGRRCTEGAFLKKTKDGEISCGYYKSDRLSDRFRKTVETLFREVSRHVRNLGPYADDLSPYRSPLRKLVFAAAWFDSHFRFLAEREGETVRAKLLCLDPSDIIRRMNGAAKAVIYFSATLSPLAYYQASAGSPRAPALDLPSPYAKENLCLVAYDSISTRLPDRENTAEQTAMTIAEAVSAKAGRYLVYFPSYAYLKAVFRYAAPLLSDAALVVQKAGMSYRERERFLSVFGDSRYPNVVGFCVLGGMFSEGIDLAGEKLIGAVVVGTGMPGLSAERNLMMEYYDDVMDRGREFAYLYPGMNKVTQAAGRVIRSESDRGIVLLIDDRYAEPEMKLLFPAHWRHLRYTGDLESLHHILSSFWNETGAN